MKLLTMKNKRGGLVIISVIFMWIMFFLVWGLWLGKFFSDRCQELITTGEYTGIEAFILANINVFVVVCVLLGGAVTIYFGE